MEVNSFLRCRRKNEISIKCYTFLPWQAGFSRGGGAAGQRGPGRPGPGGPRRFGVGDGGDPGKRRLVCPACGGTADIPRGGIKFFRQNYRKRLYNASNFWYIKG